MLLVENILPAARKRLVTVEDGSPVLRAAALLSAPHVSLVIVCDNAGAAVGVLSKADIVKHISHCKGHACTIATASVMTRNIVACAPGDWLRDAWSTMMNTGIRQIPVLGGDAKPLGIVYAIDALQALLEEAQDEEQLLRDYVTGVGYH